jgi:hypothetical protein
MLARFAQTPPPHSMFFFNRDFVRDSANFSTASQWFPADQQTPSVGEPVIETTNANKSDIAVAVPSSATTALNSSYLYRLEERLCSFNRQLKSLFLRADKTQQAAPVENNYGKHLFHTDSVYRYYSNELNNFNRKLVF